MGTAASVKTDEKGRVIIPAGFREILGVKESAPLLMKLDEKANRLVLLPFGAEKLAKMEGKIDDKPGTLAKILYAMAREKANLVYLEASSSKIGESAEFVALADVSRCSAPKRLEKALLKLAREIRIKAL